MRKNQTGLIRRAALLLAAALGLSGCSGGDPGGSQEVPLSPGSYTEKPCTLPEGIGTILDFQAQEDGTLTLLVNADRNTPAGPWSFFDSRDNGGTWVRRENAALDAQGNGLLLPAAELLPDGGVLYVTLESSAEEVSFDEERPWKYRLVEVSREGGIVREEPFTVTGVNLYATGLAQAPNGDLLLETFHGLYRLDGRTFAIRQKYHEGEGMNIGYTASGKSVTLVTENLLETYDVDTGDLTESLEIDLADDSFYSVGAMQSRGKCRLVTSRKDGGIFFCDRGGIYSRAPGGTLLEQISDGTSASLNLPTRKPLRLDWQSSGAFFILYEQGEGYYLARYEYSNEKPREKTVLKLYALSDFHDGRIRQTIGQYQIEHPDMQVLYTAGITAGEETTAQMETDALRTLSTQLLAGNGPDVLVLDSLPVPEFVEKGVLLDLTERVQSGVRDGGLVSTVVLNYRQLDGKIYGIPTGFLIPMMLGDPETVGRIGSFEDFADWAIEAAGEHPEIRPVEMLEAGYLDYNIFYPLCKSAWEKDGQIDAQALREYLSRIKEISELPYSNDVQLRNNLDAGAWHEGMIALAVGQLRSVFEYDQIVSLLSMGKKEGKLALLPGDGTGYYEPKTIIGINANSVRKDQALDFLDLMLSEEVQQYEFFDGLPVNRKVLQSQLKSADIMYTGTIVVEGLEGVRLDIEANWPNPRAEQEFWKLLDSLERPTIENVRTDNIYSANAWKYYYEGGDLDACVSDIGSTLSLKNAE